jgi:hypothetical protein
MKSGVEINLEKSDFRLILKQAFCFWAIVRLSDDQKTAI